MPLPNANRAVISRRKVTEYLLSATHPVGRHKFRVFRAAGYRPEAPGELTEAIRAVAQTGRVSARSPGPHGVRYTVDGIVVTPAALNIRLRTVWMLADQRAAPQFVTAYRLR